MPSPLYPDAVLLTPETVLAIPRESCRGCGYTPEPGDYPLIDDEECEECHFDALQAAEREEETHG